MLLYKIAEKVYELESQGHEVVKMNIGELDFDTPKTVVDAGIDAINDGKTKYGSAAGEMELREEIGAMHDVDPNSVAITTGSKLGIFNSIDLLCRDSKIVSLSPGWPAYDSMARHFGASLETIPLRMENDWELDMESLPESLVEKSLLIVNNPNNPTCKVWDDQTQERMIDMSLDLGMPVLLDLAYRDLAFEKKPDVKYRKGMIICNSFSKSLAMTGWRIGYVVADKELIERIIKLNQISVTCVPKFIQKAALAGLNERGKITEGFRNACKARADAAMEVLKRHGVECTRPGAGFYVFPKLPCGDSYDVCMKLLEEHKVAMVPGKVFGGYQEHVRISLCYPPDVVTESLEKLMEVVGKCK